jgi:putative hydrolase of the HAD superfamily
VLVVTIALPGRVVVFDYGEVISISPSREDRAVLETIAGVAPEVFWPAYDAHRDEFDGGTLSSRDYWAGIGAACGRSWDLATIQRLWAADVRGWTSAEPGVIAVIEELAEGGTRLALLSNAAEEYGGLFRFSPLAPVFEQVFVSGELKLLKPDPRIYRHVAEQLAVDPADIVFIDNREANVRGAASIGIAGHVFTTAEGLRGFLTALVTDGAAR